MSWLHDGIINNIDSLIDNIDQYGRTIAKDIFNILNNIISNHQSNEDRRKLYDYSYFNTIYTYDQDYKDYVYYALRRYNIFTGFIYDNLINNQPSKDLIGKSVDVFLNNIFPHLKNYLKNKTSDIVLYLAAIDATHKYLIDKTSSLLRSNINHDLTAISDELVGKLKHIIYTYKDKLNLVYEAFVYDVNRKTIVPETYIDLLTKILDADAIVKRLYYKKVGSSIYLTPDGITLLNLINDEFEKFDLNYLPENTLIPSPFFTVLFREVGKDYLTFDELLNIFKDYIPDNISYNITLAGRTVSLTIYELLMFAILVFAKIIINALYNIDYKYAKNLSYGNNVDLLNFGLIQILVNNISDNYIDIINDANIEDLVNIVAYLNLILNLNIDYYFSTTIDFISIKKITDNLLNLPWRLVISLIYIIIYLSENDQVNIADDTDITFAYKTDDTQIIIPNIESCFNSLSCLSLQLCNNNHSISLYNGFKFIINPDNDYSVVIKPKHKTICIDVNDDILDYGSLCKPVCFRMIFNK